MVGSRYLYTYLDMYRLLANIPGNNKNCTVPRSPFQKKKIHISFHIGRCKSQFRHFVRCYKSQLGKSSAKQTNLKSCDLKELRLISRISSALIFTYLLNSKMFVENC